MTYLVAHPWDGLGKPPSPGKDYESVANVSDALAAAEALQEADTKHEEAEDHRSDADEADEQAREAEKRGAEHLVKVRAANPALAKAIEDAPFAFDNEADVREWLAAA